MVSFYLQNSSFVFESCQPAAYPWLNHNNCIITFLFECSFFAGRFCFIQKANFWRFIWIEHCWRKQIASSSSSSFASFSHLCYSTKQSHKILQVSRVKRRKNWEMCGLFVVCVFWYLHTHTFLSLLRALSHSIGIYVYPFVFVVVSLNVDVWCGVADERMSWQNDIQAMI